MAVILGTKGDDILTGTDERDVFLAAAGNDAIHLLGSDVAYGGPGNDAFLDDEGLFDPGSSILLGGRGDDFFLDGGGDDWIFGGPDIDRVSFVLGTDLFVDLRLGIATDPQLGTNRLFGVENVVGTDGSNYIIGNAADNIIGAGGFFGTNTFFGGPGEDSLSGGHGTTILNGGPGDDTLIAGPNVGFGSTKTADYTGARHGIHVDLLAGQAFDDGFGDTDTLISMTNVTGSAHDDLIVGTAHSIPHNVLRGLAGNDTLIGRGGPDHIDGGRGKDLIAIRLAPDDLEQGQIDGGPGRDTLRLDDVNRTLDLTALDDQRISGIERIDLNDQGNALVLDIDEILNISDTSDVLTVSGGASNSVRGNLPGAVQGASEVDGTAFTSFTVGQAQLLVESVVNTSGIDTAVV